MKNFFEKLKKKISSRLQFKTRGGFIVEISAITIGALFIAGSPIPGKLLGLITSEIGKVVAKIIIVLATVWLWIIRVFINAIVQIIIGVAQFNKFTTMPAIITAWGVIRDVANMFFIVLFLVMAFGTIVKQEKYSYKKLLLPLILMAIFVNFSLLICGLIIDLSQVVMLTFVNAFKNIGEGNLIDMFGLRQMLDVRPYTGESELGSELSELTAGKAIEPLEKAGIYWIATIMSAIAFWVMLIVAVILIFRIVALWFLVVISPIVFIFYIFPGGQQYAQQWQKKFFNQVIIGPVLAFFLWLSFFIVQETSKNTNIAELTTEKGDLIPIIGDPRLYVAFILGCGLLIGSLLATKQLSVAGAGMAGKGIDFMKTGAIKVAKGVGKVAAYYPKQYGKRLGYGISERAFGSRGLGALPVVGGSFLKLKGKLGEKRKYQEEKDSRYMRYLSEKDHDMIIARGVRREPFYSESGRAKLRAALIEKNLRGERTEGRGFDTRQLAELTMRLGNITMDEERNEISTDPQMLEAFLKLGSRNPTAFVGMELPRTGPGGTPFMSPRGGVMDWAEYFITRYYKPDQLSPSAMNNNANGQRVVQDMMFIGVDRVLNGVVNMLAQNPGWDWNQVRINLGTGERAHPESARLMRSGQPETFRRFMETLRDAMNPAYFDGIRNIIRTDPRFASLVRMEGDLIEWFQGASSRSEWRMAPSYGGQRKLEATRELYDEHGEDYINLPQYKKNKDKYLGLEEFRRTQHDASVAEKDTSLSTSPDVITGVNRTIEYGETAKEQGVASYEAARVGIDFDKLDFEAAGIDVERAKEVPAIGLMGRAKQVITDQICEILKTQGKAPEDIAKFRESAGMAGELDIIKKGISFTDAKRALVHEKVHRRVDTIPKDTRRKAWNTLDDKEKESARDDFRRKYDRDPRNEDELIEEYIVEGVTRGTRYAKRDEKGNVVGVKMHNKIRKGLEENGVDITAMQTGLTGRPRMEAGVEEKTSLPEVVKACQGGSSEGLSPELLSALDQLSRNLKEVSGGLAAVGKLGQTMKGLQGTISDTAARTRIDTFRYGFFIRQNTEAHRRATQKLSALEKKYKQTA